MLFTEENIDAIFGKEDAENEDEERFRQYFFVNDAYDRLLSDTSLRILVGHKGVGKSALLKRAHLEKIDKNKLSIFLRPDDILSVVETAPKDTSFISLIEHWKRGITSVISTKLLEKGASGFLEKISVSGKIDFAKFVPSIFEYISGSNSNIKHNLGKATLEQYAKSGEINVFIDDIDRGWSASKIDILNISALINAMRDIAGVQKSLKFRIGLRTDVFFLVRTSDESTDKIEGNIIWLKWSNHEILSIIAKRISTFFKLSYDQSDINKMSQIEIDKKILSKVIDPEFNVGRGHWTDRPIHNVLLSLTRKRPRDLVKLMRGASIAARKHDKISAGTLESTFEFYSNERLQDVVNEFRSELPNIEQVLLLMRPSKREKETRSGFRFTNDQISKKISTLMRSISIVFTSGKPATGRAVLQFLYKIDFITARIDHGEYIERKHFDENRFLAHEIADFGYEWEIHPAYRWALQPQDVNDVIDSLKDSTKYRLF